MAQRPLSLTLGDLLDETATLRPNAEAFVFGDRRISYSQLRDEVSRLAKGFMSLGLAKGDKVAILMGNRPEWFITVLAAAKAGAVSVGLSTWYYGREIEYVLTHSDTSILVMIDKFPKIKRDYCSLLGEVVPELKNGPREGKQDGKLPALRHVVCVGEERLPGMRSWDEVLSLGDSITDTELAARQAKVKPDDMMYLLYTSGTTAAPKAVPLLHGKLIENGFNMGERQHQDHSDRLWMGCPAFFSYMTANAFMTISTHSGCIVFQEAFDAGEALELIEKEKCTVIYTMPNMTTAMMNHPDRLIRDLSSLDKGATLGVPQQVKDIIDLGATHISNIYGLTETYGNCTVCDGWDPLEVRMQYVGTALPGNQIKIKDHDTGETLPPGQIGEICVKGYVTTGYYCDPELTAATFDDEGFFHTGDLGSLNEEGYLRFHSRLKDMIKTGGINVSPLEVEEFLLTNPKIEEAHVVGIPDSDRGEVGAACLILKPGFQADADEMKQFVKGNIASYKVPQYFLFFDSEGLPRTGSGKVPKSQLRELVVQQLGLGNHS